MTMNSSGPISLAGTTAGQSIEIELGGNGTTQLALNDTNVRALAGKTTAGTAVIMPTDFYGKTYVTPLTNSLRFQSASSQYLSRTPASAGNRQTWTWSGWVKRGSPTGQIQAIFGAQNGAQADQLMFDSNDKIAFYSDAWSAGGFPRVSSAVYRDYAAWYHIVCVADTTNATAQNRLRIYVNGSEITAWSTNTTITQNAQGFIDNNVQHMFGRNPASAGQWLDGYMTEINFIDGQALTPSSFGKTVASTGQWVAAPYTGTYGTNGFYLPFTNGTSTTTLGADSSGNGNNWTLNNFTRSAGVSDCWMYDVPSGNGGASATQPSSNYAVLNPLNMTSTCTLSKANLNAAITGNTSYNNQVRGTIGIPQGTGKYYFEFTNNGGSLPAAIEFGVIDSSSAIATRPDTANFNQVMYSAYNGQKNVNGAYTAYGASFTTNDVIGVAVDMGGGTITFYKNNVSQGAISLPSTSVTLVPIYYHDSGSSNSAAFFNAGSRSFAYTPPSGFKALCTANLPVATIKKGNQYMDATLYTGTGTTLSVTNAAGFKPDLVWLKQRNVSGNQYWFDSVRGVFNYLFSDGTNAEASASNTLTAFNSNGFTLGTSNGPNPSGGSMVAWQWQAGQGTTSSNTNGSITSTVSVNATAGFSVVTYTGNNTAGATIGHGLGIAPKMVIVKRRNGSIANWRVYHVGLTSAAYNIFLSLTNAQTLDNTIWNSTAPTSTVFTVGNSVDTNTTSDYVAYCFAEIAGFSKFGSYTGNGSADGTFCYTGFRPKFVMVKCSSVGGAGYSWFTFDTARGPYNVATNPLFANSSAAEGTSAIDIVSNGFKFRDSGASVNGNGNTYIYMAFAENPLAQSNAR